MDAAEIDGSAGLGISANPAAVNDSTGTGAAQDKFLEEFGVRNDHGVRFGAYGLLTVTG